jgi:hypothetical protein
VDLDSTPTLYKFKIFLEALNSPECKVSVLFQTLLSPYFLVLKNKSEINFFSTTDGNKLHIHFCYKALFLDLIIGKIRGGVAVFPVVDGKPIVGETACHTLELTSILTVFVIFKEYDPWPRKGTLTVGLPSPEDVVLFLTAVPSGFRHCHVLGYSSLP